MRKVFKTIGSIKEIKINYSLIDSEKPYPEDKM